MSEFTVCRTLDTHPALRYCLLLDDMRIAGGKPDYRGDNILISWHTKETYGSVDAIKSENKQLATEKAALERRIDELCAEVERLRKAKDTMHGDAFEIGAMLVKARDENAKLREFAGRMANALGIDSEWCDTSWCDTDCMVEFGCQTAYCGGETRCPAWARLRELGVTA